MTTIVNDTLAQAMPSAGVETVLYTVPASTRVTPFPMSVRNSGSAVTTFKIRHRRAGAAYSEFQVRYNQSINPSDTLDLSMPAMNATDTIEVYSASGLVVFQLGGQITT